MRKIPFAGVELTSQRVRGLRGTSELPGRPVPRRDEVRHRYYDKKIYLQLIDMGGLKLQRAIGTDIQ